MHLPRTAELEKKIRNLEADATYVLTGAELAHALTAIMDLEKQMVISQITEQKEQKEQMEAELAKVKRALGKVKKTTKI